MTTFGLRNNVFSMGDNFTTANRYPRQVVNSADTVLTMVEGPSISFVAVKRGNFGANIAWRFECGAVTVTSQFFELQPPAAGFAIDRPIGV